MAALDPDAALGRYVLIVLAGAGDGSAKRYRPTPWRSGPDDEGADDDAHGAGRGLNVREREESRPQPAPVGHGWALAAARISSFTSVSVLSCPCSGATRLDRNLSPSIVVFIGPMDCGDRTGSSSNQVGSKP